MPDERTISQIIHDCCCELTAHGIPYIFKRKSISIKVFWLICTMTSAGLCAWLVGTAILDYYNYDTVTQAKVIYETPTYFPAVSFCSLNAFTTEAAFEYVKNFSEKFEYPEAEYFLTHSFLNDIDSIRYGLVVRLLDDNFSDDERKKMGIPIEDMLLTCIYNSRLCWINDFKWFFDPYYGSCFMFNGGQDYLGRSMKDRISTKAGTRFGLQLELAIGNPNNANSYAFLNGIHVIVHNKTEKPTYLLGVKASVGHLTEIEVTRTFSKRLKQPYSDCIEDIESYAEKSLYVRTILETNYTYKQSDCFNVCLQKYIVNDCGCYMADIPFWNSSKIRTCRFNETDCYQQTMDYFLSGELTDLCQDKCPLECESITYSTSSSSAIYPSDIFASNMINNPYLKLLINLPSNATIVDLRSNILAIRVFYSSLSYLSFSELEKTSLVDLVAGIGGTLGLFLGMSFLSFMEALDLIFCISIAFYHRSTKFSFNRKISPNAIMFESKSKNENSEVENQIEASSAENKSKCVDEIKQSIATIENY